jgi:hypothetical protein
MTPHNENPAAALGGTGLPQSVISFGGEDQCRQDSPSACKSQGPWDRAREMERRSLDCARLGLTQRGPDRFVSLALASTYALAARDAALSGAL